MQPTDSIRRSGYVVALVFGLIAMFALMTGNGWTASGALLGRGGGDRRCGAPDGTATPQPGRSPIGARIASPGPVGA